MLKRLLNLIRQAVTESGYNDSSKYPLVEVSYNGKTTYAVRLSPYGLCTNPPSSSNALLLSADGQESIQYAIIDHMPKRFRNLKEGEVVVFNYISKSYIYFKANGDIDIECKNNTNINVSGDLSATIGGDATVDVSGSLEATAGDSAVITAPTIELNGNVSVKGTFTQTGGGAANFSGSMTVTGDVTAQGTSLHTHVHSGVQSGGSNTGQPV